MIKHHLKWCLLAGCIRILLWKFEAKTGQEITDNLGISINTVHRCIGRFNTEGINFALFEDERSGCPVEITDDAKAWVISVACQKSCELGYAAE